MNWNTRQGIRALSWSAASAVLVGLALLALASTAAQAGQLDAALLKQKTGAAENVLLYLHEHKYKNVGVLPFHVDKGGKEKGYDVAPLSLNLTARLENALILSQASDGELVGIIRDAAGTAPAEGIKAYQSDKCKQDDYKKLFEQEYTLAWSNQKGKEKVKADAFLTGRIINPAGKGKEDFVKVVIEIIDCRCWDSTNEKVVPRQILELTVPRDRALSADLGIAFSVPRDKLDDFLKGRGPSTDDRDELIKPNGGWRKSRNDKKDEKPNLSPKDFGGMSFALYYQKKGKEGRGEEQQIKPNDQGILEAPTPELGDRITLVLKRLDDEKDQRVRAVVVKVNGQSLWRMEEGAPRNCRKWLFAPNSPEQSFTGFYFDTEGENLQRFEVVPKATKTTGSRLGWLDITVFADGEADTKEVKEKPVVPSKHLALNGRGITARYDDKAKSVTRTSVSDKSLKEVQEALQKDNNIVIQPISFSQGKVIGSRNIIAQSGKAEVGGPIQEGKALTNPQEIASISIRYSFEVD